MTCPICNDERTIADSDGEGQGMIDCFKCTETMSGQELGDYISGFGIGVGQFADIIDVQVRSVIRWLADTKPVPYGVHLLVMRLDELICHYVYQTTFLRKETQGTVEQALDRLWLNDQTTIYQELGDLDVRDSSLPVFYRAMKRRAKECSDARALSLRTHFGED